MSKGQLSLFMILGIVLIVLTVIALKYSYTPAEHEAEELPPSVEPVRRFIEACMVQVGAEAIVSTGERGGYYHAPPAFTKGLIPNTALYLDAGQEYVPTLQDWERSLAGYMVDHLTNCTANNTFAKQGMTLTFGAPQGTAQIGDTEVRWQMELPVTVRTEQSTTRMKEFTASVRGVRLREVLEIGRTLTMRSQQRTGAICLSCMVELGEQTGTTIRADRVYNHTYLFTIRDPKSIVRGLPYTFVFGIAGETV